MTQTTRARPLSLPATLAFAANSIPIAALQLAITVHLPRYFASHLGLSLTVVGSAFALVRALDIPLDPLLGLAMDRTRTRFGRYRVWAVLGAPVLMAAFYLLISGPPGMGQGYLIGALFLMYLGYSCVFLSQLAWAATLAPSYQQRSRIFGVITALGVMGALSVLVIPVALQKLGASDAEGVEAMVWFIIAATPITTLIMVARTPERIARDYVMSFALKDYAALLGRPNVLRVLAADLCTTLGPGWMAALYLFYFRDALGFNTVQANLLLMTYIAAGFAGAPASAWLANRIGKHRALLVNTTIFSLCVASTPLYPRGEFAIALPGMFLAGAMAAGFTVMIRALTGDVGDEVRLHTGREWMGLIYALTNATGKLGSAAAIFLTYRVLDRIGYRAQEGVSNTAAAVRGLELAFLIGPIVFVMLGGACFFRYKLTAARHAEIRRQLDARDLDDTTPPLEAACASSAASLPDRS